MDLWKHICLGPPHIYFFLCSQRSYNNRAATNYWASNLSPTKHYARGFPDTESTAGEGARYQFQLLEKKPSRKEAMFLSHGKVAVEPGFPPRSSRLRNHMELAL